VLIKSGSLVKSTIEKKVINELQPRLYKPALREVIYKEEEQRELLNKVIDSFVKIVIDNKSEFPTGNINNFAKIIFTNKLYGVFHEYLFCFKHPTFKEEKEWRFIYTPDVSHFYYGENPQGDFNTLEIEYRESGGYMVPYLKVNIAETIENDTSTETKPILPFEEIISGPGLDKQLARASLNAFIERKGYAGYLIYIKHSDVPMRNM
jgi:hypothetical protein